MDTGASGVQPMPRLVHWLACLPACWWSEDQYQALPAAHHSAEGSTATEGNSEIRNTALSET